MSLLEPLAALAGRSRRSVLVVSAAVALAVTGTGVAAAAPTVPGLPTAVTAVAGNNTARVTWVPPADVNLLQTSYEVTASPGGERVVVPATERGATVRFLTNGTAYTFTVAAVDFDDIGPLSAPSLPVTPLDICTVVGTPGDDVLTGTPGDDAICGLGGNDTLRGGGGGDTFVGGDGQDFVDFADASSRVSVNLAESSFNTSLHRLGWADGDGSDVLRADVESVRGSAYADVLEGNEAANTLVGRGGADLFRGWGGNDEIVGGEGNDELWGLSGDDRLIGGGGNDTMMPRGDDDYVDGGAGSDTVSFTRAVVVDLAAGTARGVSDDVLLAVENVDGSPEADILRGSSAINVLSGGDGDDSLAGLAGDDQLYGDDGNDALNGGSGLADRCDGGLGTDTAGNCESVIGVP